MDKLTPKQRLFVDEYLKDGNATQAALRAGYKESTAKGANVSTLAQPRVQAAIQKRMKKRSEQTKISYDMIMAELSHIAFSNLHDIATWDEDTLTIKSRDELTASQAASIKEITYSHTSTSSSIKIKRYDKIKALELLMRHIGMVKDKTSLDIANVPEPLVVDISRLSVEERLELTKNFYSTITAKNMPHEPNNASRKKKPL